MRLAREVGPAFVALNDVVAKGANPATSERVPSNGGTHPMDDRKQEAGAVDSGSGGESTSPAPAGVGTEQETGPAVATIDPG